MVWFSYVYAPSLELDENGILSFHLEFMPSRKKTLSVKKNTSKRLNTKFSKPIRKLMSVLRILFYILDVGLDIITAYGFFFDDDWSDRYYGIRWGYFSVAYIVLPMIVGAIFYILDVARDPNKNVLTKIKLVISAIVFAPVKPLHILIKAAVSEFKDEELNQKAEDDAVRVKLLEAVLEALPQSFLQMLAILYLATQGKVSVKRKFSLATSIITLCYTIATSTYLFNATIISRVTFFFCGILTVMSRLMLLASNYALFGFRAALLMYLLFLLTPSIFIWFEKRIMSTPLAKVHHQCNRRSMLHIALAWNLNAVYNCFTYSGLAISFLTMSPAIYMTHKATDKDYPVLFEDTMPLNVYPNVYLTISAITFIINLFFVTIPIFRCNIGDHWLNKDEGGRSWLY